MRQIIKFLTELQANNNRQWFTEHKEEYRQCQARFNDFAAQLIDGIRQFDDTIGELTPKDSQWRIYRDVRFSADKSPYKTHMGVFVAPGGKKSGYSGYYLQVGPDESGYDSGCMMATGNYCCEPDVLRMLREDIAMDDDGLFDDALAQAHGFSLDMTNALKRVPAGFNANHRHADLLRLRTFCLLKDVGHDYMLQPGLLDRALADFRTTMPFLRLINRAVEYSKTEDRE